MCQKELRKLKQYEVFFSKYYEKKVKNVKLYKIYVTMRQKTRLPLKKTHVSIVHLKNYTHDLHEHIRREITRLLYININKG